MKEARKRRQNAQISREVTDKLWMGMKEERAPLNRPRSPVNERPLSSRPDEADRQNWAVLSAGIPNDVYNMINVMYIYLCDMYIYMYDMISTCM